jgi:hypothetical protein
MFFTAKTQTKKDSILKEKDSILNETQKIPSIFTKTVQTEIVTYESLRQKIRDLAYSKWEQAGHPWGRDKEFWIEAEIELFGENPLVNGGYQVKSHGSFVLVCPLNNEVPIEVQFEESN